MTNRRLRISAALAAVLPLCALLPFPARCQTEVQTRRSPSRLPPTPRAIGCPLTLDAQRGPTSSVMGADFVGLKRDPCPEQCAAYTVRLYGNGIVEWTGDENVADLGSRSGAVALADAQALINQFRQLGFWALCERYQRAAEHGVTIETTLEMSVVNNKTVVDYAEAAPYWLRNLDTEIDRLTDTHRWRHGDPATETMSVERLRDDLVMPKPGVTDLMKAAARTSTSTVARPGYEDFGSVSKLLREGAQLEDEDASGWTALMYAAGPGTISTMKTLLAAGANANHRSRAGETPIFAAVFGIQDADAGNKIRALRAAGAEVNAINADGDSALMVAARHRWQAIQMATLLELGADPKAKNAEGRMASELYEAAAPLPPCDGALLPNYCTRQAVVADTNGRPKYAVAAPAQHQAISSGNGTP